MEIKMAVEILPRQSYVQIPHFHPFPIYKSHITPYESTNFPPCFMVYVQKKTIHIHINPYESTMFHGLCPK